MEPLLLRLRSGKTAARVVAFGFGGGTMLLGLGTVAAGLTRGAPVAGTLVGYGVAALPFVALAIVVALCRSELWFVPDARAFRLLTYRPWRLGPRVEQAPLEEYAGVRIDPVPEKEGSGTLVSLVAASGEPVALRQFAADREAHDFAESLATATGLWLRSGGPGGG